MFSTNNYNVSTNTLSTSEGTSIGTVNQFLKLVNRSQDKLFVQTTGKGRCRKMEVFLPLSAEALERLGQEGKKKGLGVSFRSNWVADNDIDGEAQTFVLEFDADVNGEPISLDEQLDWYIQSGLPFTALVWTGGKSIHAYVTITTSLETLYWQDIAYGYTHRLNQVAAGRAELDESSLKPAQAYKLPGTDHQTTGEHVRVLWLGERVPNHIAQRYEMECPQRASGSKVYKGDIEKAYTLLTGLKAEGFTGIRDVDEKEVLEAAEAIIAKGQRGKTASKCAFRAARNQGVVNLVLSRVLKGGDAAEVVRDVITKLLDICEKYYAGQKRYKGGAWDREEYGEHHIARGLGYGLEAFLRAVEPTDQSLKNAQQVNARYISELGLEKANQKLVVVKSIMGTGKTRAVVELIKARAGQNPDFRVLWVTHRVALVEKALADLPGLGFTKYSDPLVEKCEHVTHINRYITTYDSLHKFVSSKPGANNRYDLVILDELDQAEEYLYLAKETSVCKNRLLCHQVLSYILEEATQVLALSGTMAQMHLNLVQKLGNIAPDEVLAFQNERKPAPLHFTFYDTPKAAKVKAISLIASGKKVFIIMDDKSKAEELHGQLQVELDIRGHLVTADTAQDYDLQNLEAELSNLAFTVATPTLSTGISFDGNWFDTTVGIFTNFKNIAYYDVLQAMARVRKPNDQTAHIYVDNSVALASALDPEYLARMNNLREVAIAPCVTNIGKDFRPVLDATGKQVAKFQLDLLVRREQGKVARGYKVAKTLKAAGHTVSYDDYDAKGVKLPKSELKEKETEAVFNAETLTDEQVAAIQTKQEKKQRVSPEEKAALEKYWVCKKMRLEPEALTCEDVAWCLKSKSQKTLELFKLLRWTEVEAWEKDLEVKQETGTGRGYDQKFHARNQRVLLGALATLQPVIGKGSFTKHDLKQFERFLWEKVQGSELTNREVLKQLGVRLNKHVSAVAKSLLDLLEYNISEGERVRVEGLPEEAEDNRATIHYIGRSHWQQELANRLTSRANPDLQRFLTSVAEEEGTLAPEREAELTTEFVEAEARFTVRKQKAANYFEAEHREAIAEAEAVLRPSVLVAKGSQVLQVPQVLTKAEQEMQKLLELFGQPA